MQQGEANLTQMKDDVPALLMAMNEESAYGVILLSEGTYPNTKESGENIWYLCNGASNQMTRTCQIW